MQLANKRKKRHKFFIWDKNNKYDVKCFVSHPIDRSDRWVLAPLDCFLDPSSTSSGLGTPNLCNNSSWKFENFLDCRSNNKIGLENTASG